MRGIDDTARRPLRAASRLGTLAAFAAVVTACTDTPSAPTAGTQVQASRAASPPPGPHVFSPPVFDIAATPDGSILVAETVFPPPFGVPAPGEDVSTIKEIHRGGVRDVVEITTQKGLAVNGLATEGRGHFFATTGGLDLAIGAGVLHATRGGARLVGDIDAFETEHDPDAFEGREWKDLGCEAATGFTAGPQSNPYHLARLSGGTVLVGDAAGNTLLLATTSGLVDWVAVFTPATADGSGSDDPDDWMVLFPLDADTDCYVQPVPTSVAVGPDGAYYVGELTGVTAEELAGGSSTGLSRVWRIEGGARNVVCPSAACQVVLSGFTSIIDLGFGPDGKLYVVEYDEAGWWTATVLGMPSSGTINRCDVETGACAVVKDGLTLPAAITFDKWGRLWVLENHLVAPTVRRLD